MFVLSYWSITEELKSKFLTKWGHAANTVKTPEWHKYNRGESASQSCSSSQRIKQNNTLFSLALRGKDKTIIYAQCKAELLLLYVQSLLWNDLYGSSCCRTSGYVSILQWQHRKGNSIFLNGVCIVSFGLFKILGHFYVGIILLTYKCDVEIWVPERVSLAPSRDWVISLLLFHNYVCFGKAALDEDIASHLTLCSLDFNVPVTLLLLIDCKE